MLAIIVIAALVVAAAGVSMLFSRRERDTSLERHERALDALRELADHPQPIPAEPPPPPTDHVKILHDPPPDVEPHHRARRPVSRRDAARMRPPEIEDRPVAAHLPTRPSADDTNPPVTPSVPAARGSLPVFEPDSVEHRGPRFTMPSIRISARVAVITALAAVTVVIVGALVAIGIANPGGTSKNQASPPTTTVTAPPTTKATTTTTVAPATAQFVADPTTGNGTVSVSAPFTLTLATTDAACWVSVDRDNGQTVFTGTLQPGAQQQVPATGPLTVRLGNTSAIQISVNGAPLQLPGVAKTANVRFAPAT